MTGVRAVEQGAGLLDIHGAAELLMGLQGLLAVSGVLIFFGFWDVV